MEWLILFPTRRLDLDVVPWPAALPSRGLFRPEPFPRKLAVHIRIRKVGVGLALERRKARDVVAQLACPVFWSKIVQLAEK